VIILGSSNAVQNGMTSTGRGRFVMRINMPVVAPAWKQPSTEFCSQGAGGQDGRGQNLQRGRK
jgi:hypothetical protein